MTSFPVRTIALGLLAGVLLVGPPAGADPADEASFTVLPHFSAQARRTVAWGVSGDGSIVVGESDSAQGTQAFRWTEAGGMEPLGDLAGGDVLSVAYAISDDGTVICGASQSALSEPNANEAFRWTSGGGMVGLGLLEGGFPASAARAASADGALLAGSASSRIALFQAMRWTQAGGMVGLPGGGALSANDANGVSDDGTIIVGRVSQGAASRACRWVDGGLPQIIDGMGPAEDGSTALACNSDASVVVGTASIPGEMNAFVWRESTGVLESIGDLPG
jgi:probable HAF family extracellular repeat protein